MQTLSDKNPSRIAWPDYARGIAILLVVFRHLLEGLKRAGLETSAYHNIDQLNIAFSGCRIPVFFIVSGFFAARALQKKSTSAFVRGRAGIILYPYLLWGSIQIFCQLLFPQWVNAKRSVTDFSYLFYNPGKIDQFWYLYALFNVAALYAIARKLFSWGPLLQLAFGVVLFGMQAWLGQFAVAGSLSDVMYYYLFFAIGAFVAENRADLFSRTGSAEALLILFVIFVVQLGFYQLSITGDINDFISDHPFYFLLITLSGAALMISFSSLLAEKRFLPFLASLGRYSLYIYLWHVFFVAGTRIVLVNLMHIQNAHILVIAGFVTGIICPIVLYRLAKKAGCFWLYRASSVNEVAKRSAVVQFANV